MTRQNSKYRGKSAKHVCTFDKDPHKLHNRMLTSTSVYLSVESYAATTWFVFIGCRWEETNQKTKSKNRVSFFFFFLGGLRVGCNQGVLPVK